MYMRVYACTLYACTHVCMYTASYYMDAYMHGCLTGKGPLVLVFHAYLKCCMIIIIII